MKKLLGILLLNFAFAFGHLVFAQNCTPDCRSQTWEVLDSGCMWTETDCYDVSHPYCTPAGNHCCYFERAYSVRCGVFYWKACYRDSCNT